MKRYIKNSLNIEPHSQLITANYETLLDKTACIHWLNDNNRATCTHTFGVSILPKISAEKKKVRNTEAEITNESHRNFKVGTAAIIGPSSVTSRAAKTAKYRFSLARDRPPLIIINDFFFLSRTGDGAPNRGWKREILLVSILKGSIFFSSSIHIFFFDANIALVCDAITCSPSVKIHPERWNFYKLVGIRGKR